MTSILSADLLIADIIVAKDQTLRALTEKYHLKPGGKMTLSKSQYDEFTRTIAGHDTSMACGGSSANMLTTLSKLLERRVTIRFIAMAGDDQYGVMVRDALEKTGIKLLPKPQPAGVEAAVSFVMMMENGQCTIATWPGNARALMKPEMIEEDIVRKSDIVFVQGSLWKKFDRAFPDRLLDLRSKFNKELWFALPTYAGFDEETAGYFRSIVPDASLVLGNDEELARVYCTTPDDALKTMRTLFKQQHHIHTRPQIGFITGGSKGAAIVTADGIDYVPTANVGTIVNTLGAGDTSYAGFAAGYLKGLAPKQSAAIAMKLAAEKLKINDSRLSDPQAALGADYQPLA